MSISNKIVTAVLAILLVFIICNLYALQHFTSKYFVEYVQSVNASQDNALSSDMAEDDFLLLENLLENPDQYDEVLEQYEVINQDLEQILSALRSYVDTSKTINESVVTQYFIDQGVDPQSVDSVIDQRSLASFFTNLLEFSFTKTDLPAYTFVMQVLQSMFWVNVALVCVSLVFIYIFVRITFAPISKITTNIQAIVSRGFYDNISYQRRDEFFALIDSINQLNEKLSLQEKIRSQFLADMSHELKTPITAIKCYLEGIQDGVIQLNQKNAQNLSSEMERLLKITNSMMDYQRFEHEKIQLHYEDIDILELLDFLMSQYESQLSANNQRIEYPHDGPNMIFFDRDKLAQILHNVISNFIKYAGQKTTLFVIFSAKKDAYHLVFEDNGAGVDSSEVPFLKEKFYQSDMSKSDDITHRGIGVGLSIVQKILDACRGECTIESGAGKGFRLIIIIPRES